MSGIKKEKQDGEKGLFIKWKPTQLLTSINCLVYGTMCLYYERKTQKIYYCQLSIHEQYINIMHIIINQNISILFQLHTVDNISDEDLYIKKSLHKIGYEHFIVVHVGVITNYVLVMLSENEKNVIWEGLQYFIKEAKQFYSRIWRMDPFKAQTALLFLQADADGSGLLDIEECYQIFKKLKINADIDQMKKNILEINQDLYEKQNLKRTKGFQMNLLTSIGFEYLLRFSSMKQSLAPIFNSLCPLFKLKYKKYSSTITSILKNQNKPLMSDVQLKQFRQGYFHEQNVSLQSCSQLIHSFPVYDGQGRQIPEQCQFMSFHHFCSYVFTTDNSMIEPKKLQNYQDMNLPLNQYFIYSSFNTYLESAKKISSKSGSKLQMYEVCLKKGCRSMEIDLQDIKNQIVVKHKKSEQYITLQDALRTIRNIGFNVNSYPIILVIQNNCRPQMNAKVLQVFNNQIGDLMLIMTKNQMQLKKLPSPAQLKNRILLLGDKITSSDNEKSIESKINFNLAKVDFQKKGHTCWNTSQLSQKVILSYQQIQIKNLTDYARRTLIRSVPNQKTSAVQNYDPMPMFRNGIQLISFHIQKQDINHYIIHSKFLENGGNKCGYLLKPAWMRGSTYESLYASDFHMPTWEMNIKVLAGQKFVIADTDKTKFFIQVYVKGLPIQEAKNKKFVSQPVIDGFYANFQLQCSFQLYCLDISCLVFSVIDEENNILAARAVSLNTIRNGLRTIQLLGPGMQQQPNSCLLALCETKKIKKLNKKQSIFE